MDRIDYSLLELGVKGEEGRSVQSTQINSSGRKEEVPKEKLEGFTRRREKEGMDAGQVKASGSVHFRF